MATPRVICPKCQTSYTLERCGVVLGPRDADYSVVCGVCQAPFDVHVEHVEGTPLRVEPEIPSVLLREAIPARSLPQTWLQRMVQEPVVIPEVPAVYGPGRPELVIPEVPSRHIVTTISKES